jgi:cell division protein FtsN
MANRDSFDDFENDDQDDGFLTFDARDEEEDRSRGPLVIAAIVAVLLICGIILWQLYDGSRSSGETPQVAADTGAFKAAPADTGGIETADLDKGVFDATDGTGAPPLDVLPATGAEDPLLADGTVLPATQPTQTPGPAAAVPAPTPAPTPRPVAVAPKPAPAPKPVVKAAPAPAPVKVAQAAPTPRPVTAPASAPKVTAPSPAVAKAPVQVAQAATPAPAPKAAPAVASTPAPTPAPARASSGGIAAQLGSFQTRASADTALARYRASGLSGPVSVVAADLGAKGTWYRIRATGFDTRAEVDSFCSKARGAGAQCIPSSR